MLWYQASFGKREISCYNYLVEINAFTGFPRLQLGALDDGVPSEPVSTLPN